VSGVDVSGAAVQHARERYGAVANLDFQQADCTRLPFEDDSFDRVVSFETLEHLEPQDEMLGEFRRVLKPEGFAVISSPDKSVYTDKHGNDNAFHVRELYRDELEALLGRHFPAFRLFGQKLLFHSAIWSLESARRLALQHSAGGVLQNSGKVERDAMYFIALCAADAELLPRLDSDLWLFDDPEETVYTHYHGEIRRNMAAGGIIEERDREIARLREALAEAERRSGSWIDRLFGRR
jgi:SAM-dependent methyltransferase